MSGPRINPEANDLARRQHWARQLEHAQGCVRGLMDHDPDEDGKRMTDWEVQFIERMSIQKQMTERQIAKVFEVWARVFS